MYNKCVMAGYLTREPELRYTNQGTAVCNFSIAINSGYGDNKEVLFLSCVAWKKVAENVSQYLDKGSPALVEGRLTERTWESDGETKKKMELVCSNVVFLGKASKPDERQSRDAMDYQAEEQFSDIEPF